MWSAALAAIGSAGYSAFLFAQAKGRELWQSPLLFWHLLVQAIAAGAAMLITIGSLVGMTLGAYLVLRNLLAISLLLSLAMILIELSVTHRSEEVRRASALFTRGVFCKQFYIFVLALGVIAPLALLLWAGQFLWGPLAASMLALLGLWTYEHLWVRAGQAIPLS
jgi:Ni/Fe-hydrogenase subunit HybB-like protein